MRREQQARRSGKSNGRSQFGTSKLQELVKATPNIKREIQALIDEERDVIEQGADQIKSLYSYMKANWKTVLPALAVLGVGAFLINKGPKDRDQYETEH